MVYLISKIKMRGETLEAVLLHEAIDGPDDTHVAAPGQLTSVADVTSRLADGDVVFCVDYLGEDGQYDIGSQVIAGLQSVDQGEQINKALWQLPQV